MKINSIQINAPLTTGTWYSMRGRTGLDNIRIKITFWLLGWLLPPHRGMSFYLTTLQENISKDIMWDAVFAGRQE